MRFKYKIGDVLEYKESRFIVCDLTELDYEVLLIDDFKLVSQNFESCAEKFTKTIFNKGFIERHCNQIIGSTAKTIRILYGESEQTK